MSWEHDHYKATCAGCGHEGECIKSSDDWNRFSTSYVGFSNDEPNATAVARKRVDSRDSKPRLPGMWRDRNYSRPPAEDNLKRSENSR